jgi:hypothetical protein
LKICRSPSTTFAIEADSLLNAASNVLHPPHKGLHEQG